MGAGSELFKLAINPLYGIARIVKYANNPDDPDNSDFSQIVNTLKGLWDDYNGNTANRENISYQEKYNQEVFNRADSQYQRTVADLRSAGLSSQLAAGSPVTIGGQAAAPQRTVGNESAAIANLVNMITNLKQTQISNKLASAQADNIKADTAIKTQEAAGFGEYRQMELLVMGASASLNTAYTRLAQIDGQTRAAKNFADLQNTLMQNKYLDKLIALGDKNLEVADSQIALNKANALLSGSRIFTESAERSLIRKQIKYISSQIVTEGFRQENFDADTKFALQNTANALLNWTIDSFTFDYKKRLGDSPDSTEVSSTQSEEKKKEFKRDLILQGISTAGNLITGIGAGAAMMFFRTGGANRVKRKTLDWYRENF